MIAFPWLRRRTPPADPAPHRPRFMERHLTGLSLSILIGTLFIIVLYPHMVVTVPTGHVGVLWKRFNGFGIYCLCFVGRGTVLNPAELREEGLHLIWPWDVLFIYDLRLQKANETYNTISKDGVSVTAAISIRYQLKHDDVAVLHKFIGPGYLSLVVQPEIGSQAREIISNYTAEQVYSTQRQAVQDAIRESAQRRLGERLDRLLQPQANEQVPPKERDKEQSYSLRGSIEVLDTPVLGIELPPSVVAAINRKIEMYYASQEYDWRIAREKKESERKRIEAAGIHDFQQIVSQGISDSYLRWRGIEATLQLAQSPNSKVVIVGGGKDGLPIILNAEAPAAPAPASAASSPPAATPADAGAAPSGEKPASTPPPSGAAPASSGSTKPAGTTPDSEKASPPSGSEKPSEKSESGAAKPSEDKGGTPSRWSFSFSDLKDVLTGAAGKKGSEPPSAPRRKAEKSSER